MSRARAELEWFLADRVSSAAVLILVGGGTLAALIAGGTLEPGRRGWFFASPAVVVLSIAAGATLAHRRSGRSFKRVATSPFAIAGMTWLALFVLRPLDLYLNPENAVLGLGQIGFSLSDLSRTSALGALGCACWTFGYLIALGRTSRAPRVGGSPTSAAISGRGAALALAVGTVLWGLLFLRQGGPRALVEGAGSIRTNQTGSFYGFVGLWLVQGVALVALAAALQGGGRVARRTLLAAVPLVLASAVALELRGLATFAAVSAVIIFVSLRRIRRSYVVAGAVLAVVGVLALGVTQQIRAYSTQVSTAEAIRLTAKTPLGKMYESDLSTFDYFVAIQSLVPDRVPYLDGRTLFEIPLALIPRAAWPEKPLGIDFRTSGLLYPGVPVAVPISLQGELYWNGGLTLVALGAAVVGAAFGVLGRMGLRVPAGSGSFLLYAMAVPFTHAFLTRGLATMTANFAFALIGVCGALLLCSRRPADEIRGVVDTTRARFVAPSDVTPRRERDARRLAFLFDEFADRLLVWRGEDGRLDASFEHDYAFYRRQLVAALERTQAKPDGLLATLAGEPSLKGALNRWRDVPDDRFAAELAETRRRLAGLAR